MVNRAFVGVIAGLLVALAPAGAALAAPSPNGPGQPGAPGTTCQQFTVTPGGAANSVGSPFSPTGVAGNHYAGNPGTASAAHAGAAQAVSQYDIACFQQTTR